MNGLYKKVVVALVFVLLSSCVTTEERIFNVETSDQMAIQSYVDLALGYMAEGLMEEAKRPLNLARKIDDESPLIYAATAYLMQKQGDAGRAEQNFLKALELDPGFQAARNNYGAFLYQQKRYQEAHDVYKVVAEDPLYPRRFFAYENLGFCAIELNEVDLAEGYFKKALLLNGNLFRSVVELAEIEYGKRNYSATQRYLDQYQGIKLLNKMPNTAKILWLQLRLAIAKGAPVEQMKNVRMLSAEFPDSEEYQLYLRSLGDSSGKAFNL